MNKHTDSKFKQYNTWEEVPISKLTNTSESTKICYIALTKDEALKAINTQCIPNNSSLYEYANNIEKEIEEVIIGVEIDITNLVDLTSKNTFNKLINSINDINSYKKDKNIELLKTVEMYNSYVYKLYYIKYNVINNSVVKRVIKFR